MLHLPVLLSAHRCAKFPHLIWWFTFNLLLSLQFWFMCVLVLNWVTPRCKFKCFTWIVLQIASAVISCFSSLRSCVAQLHESPQCPCLLLRVLTSILLDPSESLEFSSRGLQCVCANQILALWHTVQNLVSQCPLFLPSCGSQVKRQYKCSILPRLLTNSSSPTLRLYCGSSNIARRSVDGIPSIR